MNTKTLLVGFSSLALVFASTATFVACSSDDNANPSPTPLDASVGTDTGVDSAPGADTGGGNADSGADAPNDAPDATPCTSDAATCNSCVTQQSDPLHACSPATANCIPFDNATRVPANVPQPQ
jgi:hypothetical protein